MVKVGRKRQCAKQVKGKGNTVAMKRQCTKQVKGKGNAVAVKRQCAKQVKGKGNTVAVKRQIQKPIPKKSIKGKVTMIDNIIGKTFHEGSVWYLVTSGSRKGWMKHENIAVKGTPTAKLYLKTFMSGVTFGSGGAEEEDWEDPRLSQQIEKEFMDQGGYDDPKEYCVGKILSKRGKRGQEEYFVKWVGYSSEHNSWVTKDCFQNSRTMLRIFESGIKAGKNLLAHVNTVIDNILEF